MNDGRAHGVDLADRVGTLLRGCLDLWEIDGRVERRDDGAYRVHAGVGTVVVSPADGGGSWIVEIPADGEAPAARWSHASALPLLRSLRAVLAPGLPPSRLVIARGQDGAE